MSETHATPPNIFPALLYRDAGAALDWLERVFGFEKLMVVPGPDGTVVHSEIGLGPGIVMVATAKPEHGWVSPLDLPAVNQTIYVQVDDVDAHHQRAKAEGANITFDLKDTDYGSREYSARDLEGHFWSFGTYRPSRKASGAA
jgi:uncharacterized glyoxalase superfamily protein PhnB